MLTTRFQEMMEQALRADAHSGVKQDEFMLRASQAHIFVFKPVGADSPIRLDETVPDDGIILDLPFPTCYFEMENAMLTVGEDQPVDIISMLVHEVSPKQYEYYLYSRIGFMTKVVKMESDLNGLIVESLLKRLKTDAIGDVRTSERIKYRSGGKKFIKKINHLIYVTPKRQMREAERQHHAIVWDHSWEVRGHWRKLMEGRTGHDRSGNEISGFTWVRPYVKGEGELIHKVRKVKQ